MGKIKKIYKIPFLILIVILVVAAAGFFALRSPAVQTWLFDKLSAGISKNNEIEISAGDVKFTFFNRIEVHDLLINDNTADTMLYSKMVKAGIRKIKRKDRFLSLGRIDIESPVIKIHPDTSGILNLGHLARLLVQEDTAKRNKDLLIRQINIYNGELAYNSGKSPDTSQYFDLNNIMLSDLNPVSYTHLTLPTKRIV